MKAIKAIKTSIGIASVLLLAGCDQTPNQCKKYGYSGMVFPKTSRSGGSCSMGTLTPSGKRYMTVNGTMAIESHSYLKFIEDRNEIK